MNRLWVRISLVIAGVAIFIALFPVVARGLWQPDPPPMPVSTEELPELPPEHLARIEQRVGAGIWRGVWIILTVGSTIGLGAGIWLSRGLSKPLTELEKGAQAVAAHQLTYRVPEVGSSEMRAVAHSFNQMASELERQASLRRNMLADVTHELRHPVHVLGGNLQGILDGVFPLEMTEIAFLAEQTQHLSRLVNDLHELALAEAQELPLHVQEMDVTDVVQNAVDAVQPLAAEKEIVLHWQRPFTSMHLILDAARIRQVVQNLLSNAINYTAVSGDVFVAVALEEAELLITVQDTGMGITADDLPHIFDRFYRSDASRSRELSGTGLGLAIAKAIVEAHNGRITASSPGRNLGSTFVIHLPVPDQADLYT
ncbi:MAG: HAMP domain-containing protein [Ardenticatenaceae bacterium]|nr:HAMP domain-containing protein [Ardenticatenaceae bacterium]